MQPLDVGGVNTTEICNLSCVMCHFNGPAATKLHSTLTIEEVRKFVSSIPPGPLWFAATGEFLMDLHALDHLRTAVAYGHRPCMLTHGQLLTPQIMDSMLEIGVREITISVDAIEPASYRRIRRGAELDKILEVCAYLRSKKSAYPDLRVTIANVLFKNTLERQPEFERFWTGRADRVSFQAEYYDTFKLRNLLYDPGERTDCDLRVYLLPNGRMAPCCAMTVYQHNRDVEWLPHIRDTTPGEALEHFNKLYADPQGPLRQLCRECDWWMMFKQGEQGHSAFTRTAILPDLPPGVIPEAPKTEERFGVFHLGDAVPSNQATICGDGPVSITTISQRWAYAALFPIHDAPELPLSEIGPLLIRIEAYVDRGEIGISVAEPSLRRFIAPEKYATSGALSTLEIPLSSPAPGCQLVVRNSASDGASKVTIHSIRTFLAPHPSATHSFRPHSNGFVPLSNLLPISPPTVEEIPSKLEVGGGGVEIFDSAASRAIDRARLEHLDTLGLPLEGRSVLDVGCGIGRLSEFFVQRGCRVVCVDARMENLERLAELYPGRERHLAHVERESLERFGLFDIVFCYGLIYHSENPIATLRNVTACCRDLLLLESVVTDHRRPVVQLVDEPIPTADQAASGFGSRPSPAFLGMAVSRMGFPYVYTTRTVPNHPDFRMQWRNDCDWRRDDRLLRCVLVASRTRLDNPQLVPFLEATEWAGSPSVFQPLPAPADEVWLDVGARLGEKTLSFAAQNPHVRVYAFEPNLKNASKLMGRLRNYIVLPLAVSEKDGSAPFYLNRFDGASSLLPFVPEGLAQWVGGEVLIVEATPTIPTIRLDTFLNQAEIAKVAYLKIDAQGADLSVLRSLGQRLRDVDRISLEVQVTSVPLYHGSSPKPEAVKFLRSAGFDLAATERQSVDQEENLTFVRRRN